MEIYTIDRAEENYFVCYDENDVRKDIPEDKIKDGKPGDVIILHDGKITIDENLTRKRREEINALQNNLWE